MRIVNQSSLIGKTITMVYKNYRGVKEDRVVTVLEFFNGYTPYHSEYQTFMKGYCHERRAKRDFSINDIEKIME
jgi:predicted DNA-binding transcriptional regulator YafY